MIQAFMALKRNYEPRLRSGKFLSREGCGSETLARRDRTSILFSVKHNRS
ncbi:MAG: hypothetical protein RIE73_36725 [Coleofasciculus sp. C1-SOL-03]